jgi:hypothetical protein
VLAIRDEGEGLVLTLTDELQHTLASAALQQLDAIAVPVVADRGVLGNVRPEALTTFLHELAQLAQVAAESSSRLYCWVCV